MRQTALNMVYELAKQDSRVVFVGSDLGVGVLQKFKEEMPDRFYMEGISEQHVIGMAAGLAMEGKIPYVNTIGTFLTRRCYEQVVLDLCLHRAPVRLISTGGGVVYAPLGPTHLAIEDIAILRPVPNMTILAPADAQEMKKLIPQTLDVPGPVFIRVAKGGDPIVTSAESPFEIGRVYDLRHGEQVLVITTGITLKFALEASDLLAQEGISVGVLHVPTIKPFPTNELLKRISPIPAVITIEEHVVTGGLGSAVAELIVEADFSTPKRMRRIGIPDMFPDRYGSQDSLMSYLGINTTSLLETVRTVTSRL